ncbi:MAG: hypothetical protein ABW046_14120 [Actinoplanes sp.]
MALTVEERVRKATAARIDKARKRRHLRYAEEIEQSPVMYRDVAEKMAETLRDLGYTVSGPDIPKDARPVDPVDQVF